MRANFFIAATALMALVLPAHASWPSSDPPFGTFSNHQAVPSGLGQYNGDANSDAYVSAFGDDLRQNQTNDMRPINGRNRHSLLPPRIDASGVPDPRI